jgi:IS5 family transposase
MRKIREPQLQLGAVEISQIKFDLRSRDEIPKLLQGLQYIYCTPALREEVFKILEGIIPAGTDPNNGRRGMDLWKILVLGTLRLNCNWDYDKLREIANNHRTLRLMLGHGILDHHDYALQTLKDNVSLLTPEVVDQINQIVVKAGHQVLGKKKEENLKGRCDSFVFETDTQQTSICCLMLSPRRLR